jgi:hypothetical protein
MGEVEYKCPICDEKFNYLTQFSYTTFGINLDFKPFGAAQIPTPVPKCPKCNFVFFKNMFKKREVTILKNIFKVNSIFDNEPDMPNYYYLAKECELLNKNIDDIIYFYHSAIWETNSKKIFNKVTNILLKYYQEVDKNNKNFYIYQLIKLDFLRRLKRFDNAKELIESLKNDNAFSKDEYEKFLIYQLELINKNDIKEHAVPE